MDAKTKLNMAILKRPKKQPRQWSEKAWTGYQPISVDIATGFILGIKT
jgi:hypothetical protein